MNLDIAERGLIGFLGHNPWKVFRRKMAPVKNNDFHLVFGRQRREYPGCKPSGKIPPCMRNYAASAFDRGKLRGGPSLQIGLDLPFTILPVIRIPPSGQGPFSAVHGVLLPPSFG